MFRKHGIFSLYGKRERDEFPQEIQGNMTFDMFIASLQKKCQGRSYPAKIHLKVVDIPDGDRRKSSSNSPYIHGDLYRRFHILLFSKKKKKRNRKLNILGLKFDFFFNLFGRRYSTMNKLQYLVPVIPQELYLEVCLSANQGNYLSIRRWVIIPKI